MPNFFFCILPTEVVVTVRATHMVTAISLGNEDAALGTPGPAIIATNVITAHVLQRADGGIVWGHSIGDGTVSATVSSILGELGADGSWSGTMGTVNRSHTLRVMDLAQHQHLVVLSNLSW